MKVSYKRLKYGLAEACYDKIRLEADLKVGRIVAFYENRQVPLKLHHIEVWSQIANVLGEEFVDLKEAPKKIVQLIHNGVLMPDESKSLKNKMLEAYTRKIGTPYLQDEIFVKNFTKNFKLLTGRDLPSERYFLEKKKELDLIKEEKQSWTVEQRKEDREKRKVISLNNKEKYGYAFVNGVKTEIANYRVEPSGIFMGRGLHPLRGMWKNAVPLENIVLNLSPDAPLPNGFVERVWEPNKNYVAKWFDMFSKKWKYVWFATSTPIRQSNDTLKFEKASRLAQNFEKVYQHILDGMGSTYVQIRKVATATFLIATLGIRVGDEKDEEETADTIGATTLRPEHISFSTDKKGVTQVRLNFLGKDSIRFDNTFIVEDPALGNLHEFTNKALENNNSLFEGVTSSDVGRFLNQVCTGITAKVFRTYIATKTVKDFLQNLTVRKQDKEFIKIYYAKKANLKAAKKLNHRRALPKNFEQKLGEKILKLKQYEEERDKSDKHLKLKCEVAILSESKDYALSTSLQNYIDPRVYFSYCERVGLNPEKLYSKTLLRKMAWGLKMNRFEQQ